MDRTLRSVKPAFLASAAKMPCASAILDRQVDQAELQADADLRHLRAHRHGGDKAVSPPTAPSQRPARFAPDMRFLPVNVVVFPFQQARPRGVNVTARPLPVSIRSSRAMIASFHTESCGQVLREASMASPYVRGRLATQARNCLVNMLPIDGRAKQIVRVIVIILGILSLLRYLAVF